MLTKDCIQASLGVPRNHGCTGSSSRSPPSVWSLGLQTSVKSSNSIHVSSLVSSWGSSTSFAPKCAKYQLGGHKPSTCNETHLRAGQKGCRLISLIWFPSDPAERSQPLQSRQDAQDARCSDQERFQPSHARLQNRPVCRRLLWWPIVAMNWNQKRCSEI